MFRPLKYAFLCAAVLFLFGCFGRQVQVNGYLDPDRGFTMAAGSPVCVEPPVYAENPLLSREIAAKIRTLLAGRGYRIAARQGAKYTLGFDFGIGEGRTVEEVTSVSQPSRTVPVVRRHRDGDETVYVHVPGETVYVPVQKTVYDLWVRLDLMETRPRVPGGEKREIWIGEATMAAQGTDIREAVDYLLPAAFDFFGRNTGSLVPVSISDSDPRVVRLRAISRTPR